MLTPENLVPDCVYTPYLFGGSDLMADAKLFGKYNDIILMLLGFLLTGIVGTYIAQVYTTKNAELAAANKIFSEHSKLIGDRYFAMDQIMLVMGGNRKKPQRWSASQIESRWDAYRIEVQKWNSSRSYNRELIRLYFGEELWNEERDLHYFFRAWGQALEHEHRKPGSVDFDCLLGKASDFLAQSHEFTFRLAEAIQQGKMGSRRPKGEIHKNPRPKIPCLANHSSGPDSPAAER